MRNSSSMISDANLPPAKCPTRSPHPSKHNTNTESPLAIIPTYSCQVAAKASLLEPHPETASCQSTWYPLLPSTTSRALCKSTSTKRKVLHLA